jgi:hypothetical protein
VNNEASGARTTRNEEGIPQRSRREIEFGGESSAVNNGGSSARMVESIA